MNVDRDGHPASYLCTRLLIPWKRHVVTEVSETLSQRIDNVSLCSKWFEPRRISSLSSVIVRVSVLKRTLCDRTFRRPERKSSSESTEVILYRQ